MSMDINSFGALTNQLSMMGGLDPTMMRQLNNPTANPLASVAGAGSLISQTMQEIRSGAIAAPRPDGPEAIKKKRKEAIAERQVEIQERMMLAMEKIAARSESPSLSGRSNRGNNADLAALAAYGSFDFDA